MQQAKPMRLVEGVDYYLEGTKFVFTSAYHRKRGYCCNSKCRHCPFGRDGGMSSRIEFAGLDGASLANPLGGPLKRQG